MRQPRKFERTQPKKLTPELIETVRQLYAGDSLTNIEISAKYGQRPNWVNRLAAKYGWPLRGKRWRPSMKHGAKVTRLPGPKTSGRSTSKTAGRSLVQIIQAQRAEDTARQRELYGSDLADIEYLRKRGFGIHREGAGIRFGNNLITFAEMREKAARERRLAAPPPVKLLPSARVGR